MDVSISWLAALLDLLDSATRDAVARLERIFLLLAMSCAPAALAADTSDVSIEKQDRVYVIRMAFEVHANARQVMSVLTDYQNPRRLTSAVRNREIISRHDGVTRVRTELRGCTLFFCKTMKVVQDVTESADRIRADIVPEGSDFRSGYLEWSLTHDGSESTSVVLEAVMEPDFFLPPLIGSFLVRRALEKQFIEISDNLGAEAALEPAADSEE